MEEIQKSALVFISLMLEISLYLTWNTCFTLDLFWLDHLPPTVGSLFFLSFFYQWKHPIIAALSYAL